jgi:hypothetical protein
VPLLSQSLDFHQVRDEKQVVPFPDTAGIDDHHCLNWFFIVLCEIVIYLIIKLLVRLPTFCVKKKDGLMKVFPETRHSH